MRIPNGKDCYPSFTGCFGNNPCLFTLQNAYFVRKRGSPLLVYLWPCVIPNVWNIFFSLADGAALLLFGQLLQIGARNICRIVCQCCSGTIFAHWIWCDSLTVCFLFSRHPQYWCWVWRRTHLSAVIATFILPVIHNRSVFCVLDQGAVTTFKTS